MGIDPPTAMAKSLRWRSPMLINKHTTTCSPDLAMPNFPPKLSLMPLNPLGL